MVGTMAGRKRAAAWAPMCSRPTKLRRLGSGDTDVSDAMAKNVDFVAFNNVAGQGGYEHAVFLNAPARAISSFDWSDLVGVVNNETSVGSDHANDLHVHVPGAVRKVAISKRVILKEIIANLQLQVYGYGFVLESADIMRAWIEMEVPPCGVALTKKREKFMSDEAFDKYEAMEGACATAISHLKKEYFVLVEDTNFEEMNWLRKRAIAAETISQLLNDVVDHGREDNKAIRDGYAIFSLEAKRLCKDYSDVFPAGLIGFESTSSAPDDGNLCYCGPMPPVSRVEQFTFRLLELINTSGNVSVLGHEVVQR